MKRFMLPLLMMLAPSALAHESTGPRETPACDGITRPDAAAVSAGLYGLTLPGRNDVHVLADCSNLGTASVEVAEVTFLPHETRTTGPRATHDHHSFELFYVLEGMLRYTVDGASYVVAPGQLAIIRPGTQIAHENIGDGPLRLLAIWLPGGELADLQSRFGFKKTNLTTDDSEGEKE